MVVRLAHNKQVRRSPGDDMAEDVPALANDDDQHPFPAALQQNAFSHQSIPAALQEPASSGQNGEMVPVIHMQAVPGLTPRRLVRLPSARVAPDEALQNGIADADV